MQYTHYNKKLPFYCLYHPVLLRRRGRVGPYGLVIQRKGDFMKKFRFLGLPASAAFVAALALGMVVIGCASSPKGVKLEAVGADQSAIVVKAPKAKGGIVGQSFGSANVTWVVLVDEGKYQSGALSGAAVTGGVTSNNAQINVPNGKHSIEVRVTTGASNLGSFPIEIDLNDVAVTYNIREATDDEKTAHGLGAGSTVYTLEKVSEEPIAR
jgi:hypothetical protein